MLLTRPINRHLQRHREGHYFVLRFDAPPAGAAAVRRKLALDPRMVRYSIIKMQDFKLGGKLGRGMEHVGDVQWTRKPPEQRGRDAYAASLGM
jgi:small subunit ribosomal protein S6